MAGIEDLTNRGVEFAENFEMPDARSAGEGANIFMDEGRIVEEAVPDKFFNNPESDRTKLFLSQILSH